MILRSVAVHLDPHTPGQMASPSPRRALHLTGKHRATSVILSFGRNPLECWLEKHAECLANNFIHPQEKLLKSHSLNIHITSIAFWVCECVCRWLSLTAEPCSCWSALQVHQTWSQGFWVWVLTLPLTNNGTWSNALRFCEPWCPSCFLLDLSDD